MIKHVHACVYGVHVRAVQHSVCVRVCVCNHVNVYACVRVYVLRINMFMYVCISPRWAGYLITSHICHRQVFIVSVQ